MVSRAQVLAIVQARGGSKGLPNKNLRPLRGHPLVAYSVASALAASQVTRTIISTDSQEIAEVARHYGAEAPFLRPAELAADDTPDFPLFEHALEWLWSHDQYRPQLVVQLRPTTPLRPCGMIDQGIDLMLRNSGADSLRGVTSPKQTPYKMWRKADDGYLLPLLQSTFAEPYNMPRQSLPATLWQTGHIDVIRTSTILEQRSLTGKKVLPLWIEPEYCIDIDSVSDFDAAARLIGEGQLQIDVPPCGLSKTAARSWPKQIDLIVFDFDGVFTDNRVTVHDDGREAVTCDRGDGMGVSLLRRQGVPLFVLSTETNACVTARCRKLQLECIQSLPDKALTLRTLASERRINLANVIYLGNDVNDLDCMQAVGYAIAPADAHPTALALADLVLQHRGGQGAVRELSDRILSHLQSPKPTTKEA